MKLMTILFTALLAAGTAAVIASARDTQNCQRTFDVNKSDFATTGRNSYFILEPGYSLVFTGTEDGKPCELVVTVMEDTRTIDGVETRVVEERESVAGVLREVSRNYYAISQKTHDVYYFGEDVDNYHDGKVRDHKGSWIAEGENRFGLAMPAAPDLDRCYFQEIAAGVALDCAKVVSLDASLSTPAGDFTGVLCVEETTSLEPGVKEYKYYARGIGLIKDEDMTLAKKPDAGHEKK